MQRTDEPSYSSDEPSHNIRLALIAILVAAIIAISAYSMIELRNERSRANELASTNQSLSDALARVQDQLQSVSSRLETLAQPKTSPRAVETPVQASSKTRAKAPAVAGSANDVRLKQLQERIASQQKQLESAQQDIAEGRQDLASTREDVDKTRQDLGGRLDSTRHELNGSIAKNHDELVALQRRGERNYFEFQLEKSKQFQRVGSLSLSLRRVDAKHKSYDLSLLVNDQKIDKKHVNIYEPISVRPSDQPVELVVNEIDNKQIKGYVSEPKYKPAAAQSPSSLTNNLADNQE
jgi:septal ring factor EnvC (AmiA/AmiB activator)